MTSRALAAPGDIYLNLLGTDTTDGRIVIYTPAKAKTSFPTTGIPNGLAFSPNGEIFVAGDSSIVAYTTKGAARTFATGINSPGNLAFDGAGNLYAIEQSPGKVYKFTPDGTKTLFGTIPSIAAGLTFDSKGNLYVAASGSGVYKFTPAGVRSLFLDTIRDAYGLAFDAVGNLFIGNRGEGQIFKLTPDSHMSLFASIGQPFDLAFDAKGNLFVPSAMDATVKKITPAGVVTTFVTAGYYEGGAIAIEPVLNKLRNISTRGSVQTGDGALIGGFITGGNLLYNNAVLIRALGPSLASAGVAGVLADPTLELHDASGNLLASNDNWQDTQAAQISATGLAPTNAKEAAIYTLLPAGGFTAIVHGNGGTTGIGLVEVYALEQ
ncbi:MAG: hypothetical protein ACR2NX_10555 [Chthoniobacterales bacterium]